jgi:hypothetical protein
MKSAGEKLVLRRRGGGSVIERSPVFSLDAEYVFIYLHFLIYPSCNAPKWDLKLRLVSYVYAEDE